MKDILRGLAVAVVICLLFFPPTTLLGFFVAAVAIGWGDSRDRLAQKRLRDKTLKQNK